MEPIQVIDDLQSAIAEVKARGHETVAIDALEKYLDALRAGTGQSIELRKLESQRTLAQYDAQTKHSIEMFKSVIESGREALNALVLVNGGAVVALLGFMGATISKGLPQSLGLNLTLPILQFGAGVLMGALGFGARYFSQASYASQRKKWGVSFMLGAIAFAAAGYVSFSCGIYGAYRAFLVQFSL
jgi:hypothetical protein